MKAFRGFLLETTNHFLFEHKHFAGIKPEDIKYWSNYAANRIFKTPEEAQQWIFDRREHTDRQPHISFFGGPDGSEYNMAFAKDMPLYQSGKSWKIGKRIRSDHRMRLKNIEIKMPDWSYVVEVAQSNGESDFKVHKLRWIPIRFTVADSNDYYLKNQKQRLENLAAQIKQNNWIEPVIYEYSSMSILEGQHRARAMKLLGFNTVPGIGIEYDEQ